MNFNEWLRVLLSLADVSEWRFEQDPEKDWRATLTLYGVTRTKASTIDRMITDKVIAPYKIDVVIKRKPKIEVLGEPPQELPEERGELHTCPYKEEINNDYETLCDCDEDRMRECRMDI